MQVLLRDLVFSSRSDKKRAFEWLRGFALKDDTPTDAATALVARAEEAEKVKQMTAALKRISNGGFVDSSGRWVHLTRDAMISIAREVVPEEASGMQTSAAVLKAKISELRAFLGAGAKPGRRDE